VPENADVAARFWVMSASTSASVYGPALAVMPVKTKGLQVNTACAVSGPPASLAVRVKVTVALFAVLVKVPSELNDSGVAVTSFAGVPSSSVRTALVGDLLYEAVKGGVIAES